MTVTNVFYPHCIILPKSVGSATISKLTSNESNFNIGDLAIGSASDVGPDFTGSSNSAPDFQQGTTQLKDILDRIDILATGVDLGALGNTDMEYLLASNRGAREADASTNNLRLRMTSNAFLAWESITANEGSPSEISYRVAGTWDGTNDPLIASNSALAGVLAVVDTYELGGVKVNGSFLGGVESATWTNNISYREIFSDGYLTFIAIDKIAPQLTVQCADADLAQSLGGVGTALSSLSFYLRKKVASGLTVADATAGHIAITASEGTIKVRGISGAQATTEVVVNIAKSGSVWHAINTASAIS